METKQQLTINKNQKRTHMETVMMLLAASLSTEEILQKLQDQMNNYLADPSEEQKQHIAAICALYLSHIQCGGTIDGAMDMIRNFQKFEQREKLFNPDKN
jgi:hypothetical protein